MSDVATATTLDAFVDATQRKRDLERQLRLVKDEIKPLEEQLLAEFADRGVSGERHASTGRLVSITRKIWARAAGGDKHRACEVLRQDPDLAVYVEETFNTNSLSAYFREQAAERTAAGDPVTDLTELLPPALRDVIELTEDFALSVRA